MRTTLSNQPRQPKGVPVGGQFAATDRADAQTSLSEPPVRRRREIKDPVLRSLIQTRRDQLAAEGYLPATIAKSAADPTTTANIDGWWERAAMTAEYHRDGGVPQMQGAQGGQGGRRVRRMHYEAGGVQLRVPDRAAIEKFIDASGGTTVDVPVSAAKEGAPALQGWVRITRHGPGLYSAEGLGMSGITETAVAESVSATMERRNTEYGAYADLVARRAEREHARGKAGHQTNSSWIQEVAYDEKTGTMFAAMEGGRSYGYQVPRELYLAVANSQSPGRVFNRSVKGGPRVGIVHCPACEKFYVESIQHVCDAAVTVGKTGAGAGAENLLSLG